MTAPHPAAVAFLTARPVRMFEPLEDVATVTAVWSEPNPRLCELLNKPNLTPDDWAELTAFEREAS